MSGIQWDTPSILEDLFGGRIYPSESCVPNSPAYKHAIQEINKYKKQLEAVSNDEQWAIFEMLMLEESVMASEAEQYMFIEGLRLGAKLTAALFFDEDASSTSADTGG